MRCLCGPEAYRLVAANCSGNNPQGSCPDIRVGRQWHTPTWPGTGQSMPAEGTMHSRLLNLLDMILEFSPSSSLADQGALLGLGLCLRTIQCGTGQWGVSALPVLPLTI